jgi:hypothetical protein
MSLIAFGQVQTCIVWSCVSIEFVTPKLIAHVPPKFGPFYRIEIFVANTIISSGVKGVEGVKPN